MIYSVNIIYDQFFFKFRVCMAVPVFHLKSYTKVRLYCYATQQQFSCLGFFIYLTY